MARVSQVDTIAALKALTAVGVSGEYDALVDGQAVKVAGYYAAGDKEATDYVWDAASTSTDNGGTVIALTAGGTGRWLLEKDQISVTDFGAVGGENDADPAAINAAITAANAAGGGTVLVPAGTFKAEAIIPKSNVILRGVGGRRAGSVLKMVTGDMFRFSERVDGFRIEDIFLDTSGTAPNGHIFNVQEQWLYGGLSRCRILQRRPDKSILYLRQTAGEYPNAKMVFNTFSEVDFEHTGAGTATVSAFDVFSTNAISFQGNAFRECGYWRGSPTQPFMKIDHDASGSANTGNSFINNWLEVLIGGWLHAYSAENWLIQQTIHYDVGAAVIADHVINLSRQATRAFSRGNKIDGYKRTSGTIATGKYDINLGTNANYNIVNNVDGISGNTSVSILAGVNAATRYVTMENITDRVTVTAFPNAPKSIWLNGSDAYLEQASDTTVIDASATTGNSIIITGMEFGRTYEIRVTESTPLDGDPTTFRLGLAADGDEFLADTAVTGATVVGAVVSGTENIGANVVLTWANTGGTAGAFTVTVVVK
jgi:hypothetical protein